MGISIIIPCYNASKTIERCLESILRQNFINREIICVDDSSTDDTVCKIRRFDSAKILVNNTNKGAAYSRNKGFKYAIYSKILFVDSDIFLPASFLQEIDAIDGENELIYPAVLYEDNTAVSPNNSRNIWNKKAQNYPLCSACFLIKRTAIYKLDELFDNVYTTYYEDTDLFLRCYYLKVKSKYVKNLIVYHTLKSNSAQKWSRERLSLECRNTLYAIIKFFPFNFFLPVNYTVRIGMFIHYFKMFYRKKIDAEVDLGSFLKIVSKSICWNLINLLLTLRKNIIFKKLFLKSLIKK